jgi:hypothetical protein
MILIERCKCLILQLEKSNRNLSWKGDEEIVFHSVVMLLFFWRCNVLFFDRCNAWQPLPTFQKERKRIQGCGAQYFPLLLYLLFSS